MKDDYAGGLVDVFVYHETASGPEFLLLKRSANERFPNIWQCVSGGIETGEKAWQTALREVKEETGFDIDMLFVADYAYNLYLHPTDSMLTVPVFGAKIHSGQLSAFKMSEEHSDFLWCSPDAALEKLGWENYRLGLQAVLRIMNTPALMQITRVPI